MFFNSVLLAALLPYVAFARHHGSCYCNADINAQCQKDACAAFGNGYKITNIPSGLNKYNVGTTWQASRCYTKTANGNYFNGIEGDDWLAQCQASCKTGSKCT
nr:uncharacterized protein CTRU02_14948 [Colletotrichum truncatum]KAF6781650.1 hypothetical protein CTRU02_14948 [Colletotrichum truncatum]